VGGALAALAGAATAAAAQTPTTPRPLGQPGTPVADSARASRPDSAPGRPITQSARSPLARQAASDSARADSLRRAAGDTLPGARQAARDSTAPVAPGDSARPELVRWVEPDSVMQALLQRTGYSITRYQGERVTFLAGQREIQLSGEPAAVQRDQAIVVGDSVLFNDSTSVISVRARPGRTVVLRDPTQGDDVVGAFVVYDLDTRTGTVGDVSTSVQSGETWYVGAQRAGLVGTQPGSEERLRFYGHDGTITSCDLSEPHYHFEARNLKVVRGSIMVARPAILYIGRVPVLWLPFVFQDMREGRRSGVLSPRLGVAELVRNSPTYRRSVENVGYYFALSDYADASTWVDWRSGARSTAEDPGFLRYNGELQYRWLDRFLTGRLGVGYENWRDGRRNLQLSWNHQQQFSQRTSFTSAVNYAQNTVLQRLGAISPLAALATIRSNAAFQTQRGPFSLNLGANQTQYTGQERVDRTLPSLNISARPISLGSWLTWTPTLSASNSENLNNQVLGELQTRPRIDPTSGLVVLDTLQFDRRNTTLSFQTPLKIFDFNLTNSITVTDVESTAPVRATIFNSPTDSTVRVFAKEFSTAVDWNTSFALPPLFRGTWNLTPSISLANVAPGGFAVRSYLSEGQFVQQKKRLSYGLSTSPTLYRRFPGFGPFEALRHSVSPVVQYSYAPAATVDDAFLQAVGQNPGSYIGALAQSQVSLSLNTVIEAKRRARSDSTAPGNAGLGASGDKVRLLALDFAPLGYDFVRAADSTVGRGLTTDNFYVNARSALLPGFEFRIDYSLFNGPSSDRRSEFNPYRTGISSSFSIGRSSSAIALLQRVFGLATPVDNPQLGQLEQTAADSAARQLGEIPVAGSRARLPVQQIQSGQGWRATVNFSSQRTRPDLLGTVVDYDPTTQCQAFVVRPAEYERCVQLTQQNPPSADALPTQGGVIIRTPAVTNARTSLTFDLTPRWSTSWNTSYDFERGDFADHQVSLQRDLHDWRAIFAFTQAPNGNFALSFFVALKAEPDLKFDYRRQSYRGR
jgi:hypothetical protein